MSVLQTGIGLPVVTDLFPSTSTTATSASASASLNDATSSSSAIAVTSSDSDSQIPSSTNLASAPTLGASSTNGVERFFQNKTAVIAVFAGGGAVLLLLIVSLITCLLRRRWRRQRQLDREMDASFRETMEQAMDLWRPAPTRDLGAGAQTAHQRSQSAFSTHSEASGISYTQPPLPVPQQQPNYDNFAYQREGRYTPGEEAQRNAGASLMVASRGVVVEPRIVQPQRAHVAAQKHAHSASQSTLAQKPSQSAEIRHTDVRAPTPDYVMPYTTSPAPVDFGLQNMRPSTPDHLRPYTTSPAPVDFGLQNMRPSTPDHLRPYTTSPAPGSGLRPSQSPEIHQAVPRAPTPNLLMTYTTSPAPAGSKTPSPRPSQAPEIHYADPDAPPPDYLTPYTTTPAPLGSGLLSPTTPFPLTPSPLPNPFDKSGLTPSQTSSAQAAVSPLSPTPSLPNPYG
ncbi:hypothetical protein B0H19DRAFT_483888 [Mycena capillaripes]|nr:hypothetical protein B0H19DRAFT_483888 [Mycena capillaripes]